MDNLTHWFDPLNSFWHFQFALIISGGLNYLTNGGKIISILKTRDKWLALESLRTLAIDVVFGVAAGTFWAVYVTGSGAWDDYRPLGFLYACIISFLSVFGLMALKKVGGANIQPVLQGVLSLILNRRGVSVEKDKKPPAGQ